MLFPVTSFLSDGSGEDSGEEEEGDEEGSSDEDEECTLAEKLARYQGQKSSRSMGRLDFLSFARMPFSDNQSLVLGGGNARKPDPSGNKHRGIGDALIAGGDEGQQVAYQTAVVSIQMAVRPDTDLGDKFEEIGCLREVLATGESVTDNNTDGTTNQLERIEGKEEWVLVPMNRKLMWAGAAAMVGKYDLAQSSVNQAKPDDKKLTFKSLKTNDSDLRDFIAMTQMADFALGDWIEKKDEWLTIEELASIDKKQATDELTNDEAKSLTLAMILTRHRHKSARMFNKLVCDYYGVAVDDSLCTAKYTVSDTAV